MVPPAYKPALEDVSGLTKAHNRQRLYPTAPFSIVVRRSQLVLLHKSIECATDPRVALSQHVLGRHKWDVPLILNTDTYLQVSTPLLLLQVHGRPRRLTKPSQSLSVMNILTVQ